MDPQLSTIAMTFEPAEMDKICKFFGVNPDGMTVAARNEAIKVALSAMVGFVPFTNNERKSIRRKQRKRDELQAELEEMTRRRESAPAPAPRAQPAQVAQPAATAEAPLRAPRRAAPQPIARRGETIRPIDDAEALPDIEAKAPQFVNSLPDFLAASDDDDEIQEREEIWAEAMRYINTIKAMGNQQKLAKVASRANALGIKRETITHAQLAELQSIGGPLV